MTKKEICQNNATIAYYSGFGGLEEKHIEYGIDDYLYIVAGAWNGSRTYHKLKIYMGNTIISSSTVTNAGSMSLSAVKR